MEAVNPSGQTVGTACAKARSLHGVHHLMVLEELQQAHEAAAQKARVREVRMW